MNWVSFYFINTSSFNPYHSPMEEGVCYDQCVLLAKLLAFALLHSVLQGQIWLFLQVFLNFLLLHSSLL